MWLSGLWEHSWRRRQHTTAFWPFVLRGFWWDLSFVRVQRKKSLQVGLGEGLAPSAATSVLSKQVPAAERSRAVATVFGGLDFGLCLVFTRLS